MSDSAVAQCGAVHVAGKVLNTGTGAVCNVGTGAVCELPVGHTGNHRGQFKHSTVQWPDRAAAARPVLSDEVLRGMARQWLGRDRSMVNVQWAVDFARAVLARQEAGR